jgi:hypothetical protein
MQELSQSAGIFAGEFLTYDNCTFFDNDIWSDDEQINNDVEQIAFDVRAPSVSIPDKYNKNLLVILVNLFVAHVTKQGMYVTYSRNRNHYGSQSRYNAQKLSYQYTTDAVDQLIDHGYIEHTIGFYDRRDPKKVRGMRSRMRPTAKLIEVFDHWSENGIRRFPHAETIILRDKDKKPVDYEHDTRLVTAMRKKLQDINAMLAEADIRLDMTATGKVQLDAERQLQGKGRISYWRKSLFRVFSNGKFTQGGRFYGGWWEMVNKDIRKRILINGQPTVEKDFKSLHPSMLYIRETGVLAGFDPYKIDGENTDDFVRKIAKSLLLIMINSKAGKNIQKAFRWNIDRNGKYSVRERETIDQTIDIDAVIDKIKKHNKTIASYFSSNEGIKLQFIDSQIVERVVTSLMRQGIVSLPVHDSFLVAERYESELIEAMKEAFMWKFKGVVPEID